MTGREPGPAGDAPSGEAPTDEAPGEAPSDGTRGREAPSDEAPSGETSDADVAPGEAPGSGASGSVRRERSFRGISGRLAVHYLENLGGRVVEDDGEDGEDGRDGGDGEAADGSDGAGGGRVEGDGWTATATHERVGIGPTLEIDEVTLVVEGRADAVDPLLERFARKAMRAGG